MTLTKRLDQKEHEKFVETNTGTAVAQVTATYTLTGQGEFSGSSTATTLPAIACKLVKIKALGDNVGNVYVGNASVTVANGTTDVTTGLQLAAGDETPWLPVSNLSQLSRVTDNAGDDLVYITLGN